MLLTILLAIVSALGVVAKVIQSVLAAIPPIGWLLLVVFIGGWYLGWQGCDSKEDKPNTRSYVVLSVPSGSALTVKIGLLGKRERTIRLFGLVNSTSEQARLHLEHWAGTRIISEIQPNATVIAYSESGTCLNREQVVSGFADVTSDAPKEWVKQRDKARKAKIGIWAIN